jgi:hypothetical protein
MAIANSEKNACEARTTSNPILAAAAGQPIAECRLNINAPTATIAAPPQEVSSSQSGNYANVENNALPTTNGDVSQSELTGAFLTSSRSFYEC